MNTESKIFASNKQDASVPCPHGDHFKIDKNGKVKEPQRLIHCSDGIIEEYSTDEDDEPLPPPVDVTKLNWPGYFWYMTVRGALGGLTVCDYLGEKLAYFFGITTPKYQYAIDELERMQAEEKEDERMEAEERVAENELFKNG